MNRIKWWILLAESGWMRAGTEHRRQMRARFSAIYKKLRRPAEKGRFTMIDTAKFDADTKKYFESLPDYLKDEIRQSSQIIEGKEDLVLCVENLVNEGASCCGDL